MAPPPPRHSRCTRRKRHGNAPRPSGRLLPAKPPGPKGRKSAPRRRARRRAAENSAAVSSCSSLHRGGRWRFRVGRAAIRSCPPQGRTKRLCGSPSVGFARRARRRSSACAWAAVDAVPFPCRVARRGHAARCSRACRQGARSSRIDHANSTAFPRRIAFPAWRISCIATNEPFI